MKKKNILMWIFCLLSWICCIVGLIVRPYSVIAFWIIFSVQVVFVLGDIILGILGLIELKREEREFEQKLDKDRKHLEELIKGYLTISLTNEKNNQEEKEG